MRSIITLAAVALLSASSSETWAAGKQLSGQHAPATTPPLSPAEAQKKFTLPEGFEARLFASEPDVINPVAMTWDDRGRLWVVELYEYPLGAPAGTKPRDRIKILEDVDGDGRADKVTIFADGLNLATAILLGNGGVYVGQAPDLLFLKDTDGDDIADQRTTLMTGFGLEDRHELLNGFTWGPDGYLYMTHGIFTHSKVKNPDKPDAPAVEMTGAVARFHPRTKKFEIFAEGTSNPWGVDFDAAGNAFVSACVIEHMFHMAPGGDYDRQAGSTPNPYAYEMLHSINDHRHFRAAYAGIQIYQGDQYPAEFKGMILQGNIHDSAVHMDRLTKKGSSFTSSFVKDFVRANDGWFRPVSEQVGPDGAFWIMDWYDRYPCYQNANADPEGVDRERGRIWRIVYTGKNPGAPVASHPSGLNMAKLGTPDLVKQLAHPNSWQRRMAQRLLRERKDSDTSKLALALMANPTTPDDGRIAAMWTLGSMSLLDGTSLDKLARDTNSVMRTWAARFTGESEGNEGTDRLVQLAGDEDPQVRLAVATAVRQMVSGDLTINTPTSKDFQEAGPILANLAKHPQSGEDPVIPFLIWVALEPLVAGDPGPALDWLAENGMDCETISKKLLVKIMRRICDGNNPSHYAAARQFILTLPTSAAPLSAASLEGMLEGQKGRTAPPGAWTHDFITQLLKNPNAAVATRARQLGTVWGDTAAIESSIGIAASTTAPESDRIAAVSVIRKQHTDAVRETLLAIVFEGGSEKLGLEAVRGLAEVGGEKVADRLLSRWSQLSPAVRRAGCELLASRTEWAAQFLAAVEGKRIAATDIPSTVVRSLLSSNNNEIKARAAKAIGRFRESGADKLQIIATKKAMIQAGQPDIKAGHELAQKTCLICHKMYGEGAEVGPDLTGVGRSSLDALLSNVIDPNQIVGQGYENVEIETKDGRSISGRMVENSATRIRLLSAGPKEETIAKAEVASMRISELSVMPEGLEQMPDADFRNLMMYILNPPQDKKDGANEPVEKPRAENQRASDGESIALWNPQWNLTAPEFEGTPAKLPTHLGRSNVLMTHPYSPEKGSFFERTAEIPSGKSTKLNISVASHDSGDWELRVAANGRLLRREAIGHDGDRWKLITVDLSQFAGQRVTLRAENWASGWNNEFAYWGGLELITSELKSAAK